MLGRRGREESGDGIKNGKNMGEGKNGDYTLNIKL